MYDDKEQVLKEVKHNGNFLNYLNGYQRDDKEVVLEAVKNNGKALRFASDRLRDNKDVVLEAVKNTNKWVGLEYASDRLKDDEEVVLEAVKTHGWALKNASERLRDDKELVLEAVKNSIWILKSASYRLQDDKDVVLEAVKNNGIALRFASYRLKDDEEVVLKAVKNDDEAWEYASKRLKRINLKKLYFDKFLEDPSILSEVNLDLKSDKELIDMISYHIQRLKDVVVTSILEYGLGCSQKFCLHRCDTLAFLRQYTKILTAKMIEKYGNNFKGKLNDNKCAYTFLYKKLYSLAIFKK